MTYQGDTANLVGRLFAEHGRGVCVPADTIIAREGEPQKRLYLIQSGFVVGYKQTPDGSSEQIMRAGTGDLIGVMSFFGGTERSSMTMSALVPTELLFIERDWVPPGPDASIEEQLMPAVIAELVRRQDTVLDLLRHQHETNERMRALERAGALGQLAAAVAHELNNALTVIVRGSQWLGGGLDQILQSDPQAATILRHGLEKGRAVSSAQARASTDDLRKRYHLSLPDARRLAQTGLTDDELRSFKSVSDAIASILHLWEIGATLNDMTVASQQAAHVVSSMRDLGRGSAQRSETIDVNATINVALQILRNVTKRITLDLQFGSLPRIPASKGELVQIWTNLIRNACDALHQAGTSNGSPPRITIRTQSTDGLVTIDIEDNGPGIPPAVADHIFEPSFTTKKRGMSFGLGLGLSIVQNLVTDYGGKIELTRTSPGATFRVTLPAGVQP
jgi:signal transduction histidine kinase